MLKKNFLIWGLFMAAMLGLKAQNTNISGIINIYTAVLDVDTCAGVVLVDNAAGFEVGMNVILYQAQGATIEEDDNANFGDWVALNGAGTYEHNTILGVSGNALTLMYKPKSEYNIGGKVQLVSNPRYVNATVTDTLRCMPWNGTVGGILALQVDETLTLQKPIVASGGGFRGGQPFFDQGGNNCNWAVPINNYWYGAGNWRAARKGEGIAIPTPDKECGRGKQANGGGGGNDHNAGGGGGGNLTAGGKGGENDEPTTFGCSGNYPGVGGNVVLLDNNNYPLYVSMRLGGGGGAGHGNNANGGAGGNGGGIIFVKTNNYIEYPGAFIAADGQDGALGVGDGGGGGGAGGSIVFIATVALDANVSAKGGKGGNTDNSNQNRCFGPGGGGGGGIILGSVLSPNYTGGAAGKVTQSSNGCNNTSNGATKGGDWDDLYLNYIPSTDVLNVSPTVNFTYITSGNTANFTSAATNYQSLYWLFDGNALSTEQDPSYTFTGASGTAKLCAVGICDTVCSEQTIMLSGLPSAAFEVPDTLHTCASAQVSPLNNAQNAGSYVWLFPGGVPSTSTLPNPAVTYSNSGSYTITMIAQNGTASDTATHTLVVAQEAFPSVSFGYTVGGNGTVQFNNTSSNVGDFSWNFGDMTPITTVTNPTHSYTQSGNYTVTLTGTNICGAGVFQQTIAIVVLSTEGLAEQMKWRVFPNPTYDVLHVERLQGASTPVRIRVYNALGACVWEREHAAEIPLTNYPSGAYRLEIITENAKYVWNIVKIAQK